MTEATGTVVSAIVAAIVALIVGHLQNRLGGHQLFAETVSRERMEWIKAFRDEIADMLAHAEVLVRCKGFERDECPCQRTEYCKARARLLSRMNLTEDFHIALMGLIVRLDAFVWRDLETIRYNVGLSAPISR